MGTKAPFDKLRAGRFFALGLVPLALSLPCFFGRTWAAGDLIRQFHPWKELGRQALMNGQLPLWNPYAYCGMPLAGNFQSGLFYPLHLHFYFMPFAPALGIHLFTHFLLSGLGAYVLGRALKLSEAGSLLMALAWSCSAFLLTRIEFMSALSAYAWTCWILAAFALRRRWQAAALLIGMQALAGYPLELGFTLLASLLFQKGLKDWLRSWSTGLALGAIVLLPGLELLTQSSRAAGLADAAQHYQLRAADLKAWFWPSQGVAWAKVFSISLATLLLAPLARGRAALTALFLCALGLCLSFGWFNPSLNRHPTLALVWLSLGSAMLTGLGAERIKGKALLALAAACLILQPLFFSSWSMQRVDASVYAPAPAAQALASKITPQRRFLLAPAVQEERNSSGSSTTAAWSNFPGWLQANTAAPLRLKDANGYDPMAPAAVVSLLNAASFPKFAADAGLLDLLGVEALGSWRKPGELSISKRLGPVPRALFLKDKPASARDLRAGLALDLREANPQELHIKLPSLSKAGWVFLNDTYYPGWKAEVDGRPVRIEKGLGAFRLLALPAGAKELVFEYDPWTFKAGLGLSLLAFLLILPGFKRRL